MAEDNDVVGGDSFDEQHKKDLSVGRFASIAAINTLVPLAALAAGAFAGYKFLGKPIKAIFPKLVGATDALSTIKELKQQEGSITEAFNKISKTFVKEFQEAKSVLGEEATNESIIKHIFDGMKSPEQQNKFREAVGLEAVVDDATQTAKYWGSGAGLVVGYMSGRQAVRYKEWKKDESARLAADEINESISQLEMFKPSDSELVSENKRLRTMLADKETPTAQINEVAEAEPLQQQTKQLG